MNPFRILFEPGSAVIKVDEVTYKSIKEDQIKLMPDPLVAANTLKLRDALARYVRAARRAGGSARRPARGRAQGPGGLNSTEVRERANALGIEVEDRGRVPAEVVVTFKTAVAR